MKFIRMNKHFFQEKNEIIDSFPKLKEVASVVSCILPSPANAERAFSRAHFLLENRKNWLSMSNLKLHLNVLKI